MSNALDDLLREGDTVGVHDGSGSAGMYDDILESMRAEGHLTTDADGSTEMTGLNVSTIPTDLDPTLHAYSNQPTPEPRQPSIPIPPGLAGLASQVQPLDLSFDDPAQALALDYIKDRGEMGGKRKKPLSERAGWKDMDAKGNMPKRARGNKRKDANSVEGFVGYQQPEEEEGVVIPVFGGEASGQTQEQEGQDETEALARDLAEAAGREMGLEQGMLEDAIKQTQVQVEVKDGQQEEVQQGSEQPEEDRPVKHTNESRAEQNRRAQQVYRRRREEKMKELEASAAALEPTRKALLESHEKMKAVALEYECTRIQISALHATLLSLNKQGVSILTTQYNFPIDPNALQDPETMRAGPLPKSDVEKAFEQLERQSRELAMSRRSD